MKEQLRDLFDEGWDFEPAYAAVCGRDRSRLDEAWGYWRAWEADSTLGPAAVKVWAEE